MDRTTSEEALITFAELTKSLDTERQDDRKNELEEMGASKSWSVKEMNEFRVTNGILIKRDLAHAYG